MTDWSGLPLVAGEITETTRRPVSPGAEEVLGRRVPVLDEIGFVTLIDYWGNDQAIEQAARLSYRGQRKQSETESLLRYLMRHLHTSPFEQAGMKFSMRMPEIVFRQLVRHRTASLNVESARYTEMRHDAYVPQAEQVLAQSTSNKQGREQDLPIEVVRQAIQYWQSSSDWAFAGYQAMLDDNVSKELARLILPMSTYVELSWQVNLHNLLHFLRLRMDEHTQWETRQFANVIGEMVAASFPITWQAFVDYQLEAQHLTRLEVEAMRAVAHPQSLVDWFEYAVQAGMTNGRERREFLAKMHHLGLVDSDDQAEMQMEQLLSDIAIGDGPLSEKLQRREMEELRKLGLL